MASARDVADWLREACDDYSFDVVALYRRNGNHSWPLNATDSDDLVHTLDLGGHFLPLPKEPAALANILEVSMVNFLADHAEAERDVFLAVGTERGYPDLELAGDRFGGGFHAVDIKVARRKPLKRSPPRETQSRITLYTGNTYFAWPDLQWPGMFRPFADYRSHLDILLLYTLDVDTLNRATDIEVIIQEPWRIASRERSSTTREYIGAVTNLERLRTGRGDFDSEGAFYRYWRAFEFRMPKALKAQLRKLMAERGGASRGKS